MPRGGRPRPRDHRDRRPDREGRRPGAPVRERQGLAPPAAHQPVRHRAADVPGVRRRAARRRRGEARKPSRCSRRRGSSTRCGRSASSSRSPTRCPRRSPKARCQEVVLTGDDVDLDVLPIQRCWPGDPAPFITLPAVITRDPNTGVRNVGMYRMQKIDRRSTFMHWQIHKDGRADLLAAPDGTIPVAVALGLDPVTAYSASAPLPKHIGELMVAGFLKGSSRSSSSSARRSTSRCPRTPRSCSRGPSRATTSGSRGRSATTPATTRRPRSSRSSGSARSRCDATRSTRRSSSASRRRRTSGSRRRPSGSSCPRSG